jgi:hypothetical protein
MPHIDAGMEVLAVDYPEAAYDYDSTLISDVSSTTFGAGTPTVDDTFIGPTCEQVLIVCSAGVRTTDRIHTAPQLRLTDAAGAVIEGTTVVQHGFGGAPTSSNFQYGSRVTLWEGIDQGQVYFLRHMHRRHPSDGTTGDIDDRAVIGVPLPFYWSTPVVGAPITPVTSGDVGDPIAAEPEAVHDQSTNSLLNLSNVDPNYQAGPNIDQPEVGVTFRAPKSGKALLIIGGGARDNTGTNRVFLTVELFKATRGSGIPVINAESATFLEYGWAASGDASQYMYSSRVSLLEGLEPGATYYARVMHSVEGGATADINVREITVVPAPANAVTAFNSDSQLNIASATYAAGSPEMGVQFTAPPSGKILLAVSGGGRDNTNNDRVFVAPQIFRGTSAAGTLVLSPSDGEYAWSSFGESSGYMYGSRVSVVSGLQAGQTHYVRTMHKAMDSAGAANGSADLTIRGVVVVPIR